MMLNVNIQDRYAEPIDLMSGHGWIMFTDGVIVLCSCVAGQQTRVSLSASSRVSATLTKYPLAPFCP